MALGTDVHANIEKDSHVDRKSVQKRIWKNQLYAHTQINQSMNE